MFLKVVRGIGISILFLGAIFGTALAISDSVAPQYQIPYQVVQVRLSENAVTMQQGNFSQEPVYVAAGIVITDSPVKGNSFRLQVEEPTAAQGDVVKAYYNQRNHTVTTDKPLTYQGQPRLSMWVYVAVPCLVGSAILTTYWVYRSRRRAAAKTA